MWSRIWVFALAVIALAWFGSALADATADAPPTVKLSGPSPYTVHLGSAHAGFSAQFELSVENDGPTVPATGYRLSAVPDRTYASGELPVLTITTPTALLSRTVTRVPVTLLIHDKATTALSVVLTVSANGILPSSQALALTRSPRSTNFVAIAIASSALGLLVLGLLYWRMGHKNGEQNFIWTPSAFTFSGSLVTSIAAVLTAVAAVFTTTGVLSSLVPGIDTSFFLGVNVVYAVVLTLAPLVYSALMRAPNDSQDGVAYGTRTGFRLAGAITAVAIGGQLSTVGAVGWLSSLSSGMRWAFMALLGVVAAVVIWYIIANADQLKELKQPSANAAAGEKKMMLLPPGLP